MIHAKQQEPTFKLKQHFTPQNSLSFTGFLSNNVTLLNAAQ